MHDVVAALDQLATGLAQATRRHPAHAARQPHGPERVVRPAGPLGRREHRHVVPGLLLAQGQVVHLHLDATEAGQEDVRDVRDPHPRPPAGAVPPDAVRRWEANQPIAQAPPTGISARNVNER